MARVEVKAKQGVTWPSCKGIFGLRIFLVFVDFAGRPMETRPDFYVLSAEDWRSVLEARIAEIQSKNPAKRVEIDHENTPVFVDEIGKFGKPRRGTNINVHLIEPYRDQWSKILTAVGVD